MKLQATRKLARAAFAGAALCLVSAAPAFAVSVTFNFQGNNAAHVLTTTSNGVDVTVTGFDGHTTGIGGSLVNANDTHLETNGCLGVDFTGGDATGSGPFIIPGGSSVCALDTTPVPTLSFDNTDPIFDNDFVNFNPSHGLGLDGSEAQNFIGGNEVVELSLSGFNINTIDSITFYEEGSDAKNVFIFDSAMNFVRAILLPADGSGGTATTREFDFTADTFVGDTLYITGDGFGANNQNGFTILSLSATLTQVIPVPPAAFMLPAGLALFGLFAYRRRRTEA